MANNFIEFEVIHSGIKKIRGRAENGIKRITADFLVNNFYEDIETMKNRGYRYDEILDELNIMLAEVVPEKTDRDKIFAIMPGTLKVYMSRKRKLIAEQSLKAANEKQSRKKTNKKTVSDETKQKNAAKVVKAQSNSKTKYSAHVPTGRATATDLDREI